MVVSPVRRLHKRSVATRGSGATAQESEQDEQRNGNAEEPQQDVADAALLFARFGADGSIVDAHDFSLMQLAGQATFCSRRRRATLWHAVWTVRDAGDQGSSHRATARASCSAPASAVCRWLTATAASLCPDTCTSSTLRRSAPAAVGCGAAKRVSTAAPRPAPPGMFGQQGAPAVRALAGSSPDGAHVIDTGGVTRPERGRCTSAAASSCIVHDVGGLPCAQ